jgi:hypothetical protein
VSVADDKLNATAERVSGGGPGLLAGLRTQHPLAVALLVRGAEVAAWVAFYFVIRTMTG